MVRKFPAGAFYFEVEGDEIRLIYGRHVAETRALPLLPSELPIEPLASLIGKGKWSAAWYHLLAFDPEKAEELRALATKENHDE